MKSSERSNMPNPPAEPCGALLTAVPDVYAAYAQMLKLMDGLPLNKQQAICRYLADHVAQKARGQRRLSEMPPKPRRAKNDAQER